jgi:type III restriction enzyme
VTLTLRFDPDQPHQLDAIRSVTRLFDGMLRQQVGDLLQQQVIPNLPLFHTLSEDWLYDNLRQIQQQNGIETPLVSALEVDEGLELEGVSRDSWRYPSFTVEMETGTGKTYVYLRTIHELRRQYGFGKFVIVVPSIAIYEGVIKNFQVTRDHFRALYGNETVNLIPYDGRAAQPTARLCRFHFRRNPVSDPRLVQQSVQRHLQAI